MARRVRAFSLLCTHSATALAQAAPSAAPTAGPADPTAVITPPEHRPREGLYGRATAGIGVTDFQIGKYLSSRAISLSVAGAVGYAPVPNVILGLELFTTVAPRSGMYFDVNDEWTNDTQLGFAGLGPALIVYAPFNSHASLSFGITQHTLQSDLAGGGTFSARTKTGLGGQLVLGHDFRLGEREWLGPAAMLYFSKNKGDRFYDGQRVSTWGAALGASFSLQ